MNELSKEVVRRLANFKSNTAPVISLYLDVDGRTYVRPKDYELHLERMMRDAERQVPPGDGSNGAREILARMESHIKAGLDRSRTRGIAIFGSAKDLWEVIQLPVPVRNHLVVNQSPHIRQLERALDEFERFGVLLADKQRGRMLVFELGELIDKSELFDQLPRHDDDKGDWDKDHVRDHTAEIVSRHFRRTAQVAMHVFKEQNFDHLILGAPTEMLPALERELHSYLRDRIAARVSISTNASDDEIRQAALRVEEQIEREKEAATVQRLRDAVGAKQSAVSGIDNVLSALVERRVDTLVVSDSYEQAGWRCMTCDCITTMGRTCPTCQSEMHNVDDVVEEAIEEALSQACRVEICSNADLDVMGRIGAFLRF